jgi:hypothetical protein
MNSFLRLISYAAVTITCLVSSLGIVNAGPVQAPQSSTVKANDPVYLLPFNAYLSQQNSQENMQQMYHESHYSHSSHESHYSHQSHYSSYR